VIECFRGSGRLVFQVNLDAVTLHRPDGLAVLGELKPLLVVVGYDGFKVIAGEGVPGGTAALYEVTDRTVPLCCQRKTSLLRLMPEH
jgi:hypothetical protein